MTLHSFPMHYSVHGIAAGLRTFDRRTYLEYIPIEVKDVDTSEAILGANLRGVDEAGEDFEELRVYKDRWYISNSPKSTASPAAGMIRTKLGIRNAKQFEEVRSFSIFDLQNTVRFFRDDLQTGEPRPFREKDFHTVESNELERKRNKLIKKVENDGMICIDGELFIEIEPPVFELSFVERGILERHLPDEVSLRVVAGLDEYRLQRTDTSEKGVIRFAIDKRDEVEQLLESIRADQNTVIKIETDAEYFFGPSLDPKEEKSDFIEEAKLCLTRHSSSMYKWSREKIEVFLNFREALDEAFLHANSDETVDAVSRAFHLYGEYQKFSPYTLAVAERWDTRPLSLEKVSDQDDTPSLNM